MAYLFIIGFFSAAYIAVFIDAAAWLINSWLHHSFYSHGIIIGLLCLCILVWNGRKAALVVPRRKVLVLWCLVGLVLAGAGIFLKMRFLNVLAYSIFCIGISRSIISADVIRYVQLPFALLILVFPLPFLYEIAGYMSYITARCTALVLGIIFPSAEITGTVISIPPDISFTIGMSCGGANSILALVTVVILWAVIFQDIPIVRNLVLAAALPVGFITNMLRVIGIFLVARTAGMDVAATVWHDWSGYFFYIVSLGLVVGVWWFLNRLFKSHVRLRRIFLT